MVTFVDTSLPPAVYLRRICPYIRPGICTHNRWCHPHKCHHFGTCDSGSRQCLRYSWCHDNRANIRTSSVYSGQHIWHCSCTDWIRYNMVSSIHKTRRWSRMHTCTCTIPRHRCTLHCSGTCFRCNRRYSFHTVNQYSQRRSYSWSVPLPTRCRWHCYDMDHHSMHRSCTHNVCRDSLACKCNHIGVRVVVGKRHHSDRGKYSRRRTSKGSHRSPWTCIGIDSTGSIATICRASILVQHNVQYPAQHSPISPNRITNATNNRNTMDCCRARYVWLLVAQRMFPPVSWKFGCHEVTEREDSSGPSMHVAGCIATCCSLWSWYSNEIEQ